MIFTHQLETRSRQELVDISATVAADLSRSGISEGLCTVFVVHTTAAVTINENADPTVPTDILRKLRQLVPENDGYRHLEGNSDAHILSSLLGPSLLVPIEQGRLTLGTWQGIYFVELDGPRRRSFKVKLLAG
jgi:secondary thiamine-phosphate synthase enzyme